MGTMDEKIREKAALLEAILFTTDKPLTVKQISRKINVRETTVEKVLVVLEEKYSDEKHGIRLQKMGGFRLTVKDKYIEHVHDLTPHSDMSRGLLRVLAIIAFHEPVKQSDIVKVIGNRTYEYVKQLKDRGLIIIEKEGRTRIIETSPKFEQYFDIRKTDLKKMLGNKLESKEDDADDGKENKESDERAGSEIPDKGAPISEERTD
ncbi:SMC-Scp complex subunit ScpB [archaeon]|nr:SMC-Scp complex subunit ScpB [archaeon]|tara:strand:+ start:2767 stop:3384 length:618 start_codon:yes stop_codon:yes gene_type:complete